MSTTRSISEYFSVELPLNLCQLRSGPVGLLLCAIRCSYGISTPEQRGRRVRPSRHHQRRVPGPRRPRRSRARVRHASTAWTTSNAPVGAQHSMPLAMPWLQGAAWGAFPGRSSEGPYVVQHLEPCRIDSDLMRMCCCAPVGPQASFRSCLSPRRRLRRRGFAAVAMLAVPL
jgi:hypothetical protein